MTDQNQGASIEAERERVSRENAEFAEWWGREQACPEHSLITENAAHAAWQERARRTPAATTGELPELLPLPKVGPICYAMVADIQEYKVPRVGKHLPGVYDAPLWSTDQMHTYAEKYARAAIEADRALAAQQAQASAKDAGFTE